MHTSETNDPDIFLVFTTMSLKLFLLFIKDEHESDLSVHALLRKSLPHHRLESYRISFFLFIYNYLIRRFYR